MNIYQPVISGSLTVTGSTTFFGNITINSGSLTMTSGSLSGTASLASNALLLQGTGSVGFATTASLLEVSSSQQQISSSQQQISASLLNVVANYATTGSNSFRANQSITGSLVVSSTITAQTLVVQTVTSSIVYSSGSNIFGNQLVNTQTFTGSLNITGSMSVTGSANFYNTVADYGLSITNVQDSSQGLLVRSSDNDTGLYILNLQSSVGATSQTWVNRLVVEKGGNVGIGTATPSYVLDIAAGSNGNVFTPAARITTSTGGAGGGTILQINHTANSVSGLQILQAGASGGNYTSINNTENGYMSFSTSGSERVRISASGSVNIGTTSGTGQALNTANAGVTNTNTYLGTGQLRVGGGSDHGGSTVLSVAPGVITFDRPGVAGGALTINSSGYVTLSAQPSFYVTSTAGSTDYTGGEVIVFNTARHNTSSCYNTTTGRFTAPVAGKYLFTLNVYTYPSYTAAIVLYINGAQYSVTDVSPYIYTSSSADSKTISFTLVWELAAGDYIEPRARSATRIYRAHSHFSGQLLS